MAVFLLYDPMKQFFQILVVPLDAPHQHLVVIGQNEKAARNPPRGNRHAQVASTIVVKDGNSFKPQFLQKSGRVSLNL
jgi:hypothetical protein